MSVRKRKWTTQKGEAKECWIVDYVDQRGERHIQTFARKKEADEYQASVRVEVVTGVHTPQSKSPTVAEAAEDWIKFVELEKRERSTREHYRNHIDNHINPRLGSEKLAKLTTPRVQAFRDDLLASLSRAQAKKVLTSLKMLLRDAKRRGNVAQNVALDVSISTDKRGKTKLKVGVDIPTPDEIKRIVHAAKGRARALLVTAIFTGLRSSELRGLRWCDVDLKGAELHVRQRADRYNEIGKPKSESGERVIPLGPLVVNTLKEWKLTCPKGMLDLVLPNTLGKLWDHADIVSRYMWPTLIAAGVSVPATDGNGKPVMQAKYTGLHALRHFYASWLINRKRDGGLELPIKTVQQRLGHASIVMTSDVYGHLFPRGDDADEMAEAENRLLA
jgi:integrase